MRTVAPTEDPVAHCYDASVYKTVRIVILKILNDASARLFILELRLDGVISGAVANAIYCSLRRAHNLHFNPSKVGERGAL